MTRTWTKLFAVFAMLTVIGVLVAGCGQSTPSQPASTGESAAPSQSTAASQSAASKPAGPTKKVVVGTLVDLSGPSALGGQIQLMALQNYFKYASDQQLVPGVTFEVVAYDDKFDASKSAAGYQYQIGRAHV